MNNEAITYGNNEGTNLERANADKNKSCSRAQAPVRVKVAVHDDASTPRYLENPPRPLVQQLAPRVLLAQQTQNFSMPCPQTCACTLGAKMASTSNH